MTMLQTETAENQAVEAAPVSPELAIQHRRMVEAILFASEAPLSLEEIAERLPEGVDVSAHIEDLRDAYAHAGVNIVKVADKFMFRTAEDLSFLLRREVDEPRKLSRAAVETMAIIAYHQPVTRAEIEEIRGVSISKGTLDVLMEAGWARMMGRKRTPGRPVTYGTTEDFLVHFGIETIKDLPGVQELKAAGLLDSVDVALDKMGGMPNPAKALEEAQGQIDLEEAIAMSERAEQSEAEADRAGGIDDDTDADNDTGNERSGL